MFMWERLYIKDNVWVNLENGLFKIECNFK